MSVMEQAMLRNGLDRTNFFSGLNHPVPGLCATPAPALILRGALGSSIEHSSQDGARNLSTAHAPTCLGSLKIVLF